MKNADKKIKLRFWQKAYLLTLALFLLCINYMLIWMELIFRMEQNLVAK